MNLNTFGKELSSTSAYVLSRIFPMTSNLSRKSSIVAMKSTGSPTSLMDLDKIFSRHARRAPFVSPSKDSFRAFQAATPWPMQLSSLLSCARTMMFADPSQMKNNTEKRLVVGLLESLMFVRWFRAWCLAEDVEHLNRVQTHCLTHSPLPTRGSRPCLDTFRCCQVLGEEQWSKSPP